MGLRMRPAKPGQRGILRPLPAGEEPALCPLQPGSGGKADLPAGKAAGAEHPERAGGYRPDAADPGGGIRGEATPENPAVAAADHHPGLRHRRGDGHRVHRPDAAALRGQQGDPRKALGQRNPFPDDFGPLLSGHGAETEGCAQSHGHGKGGRRADCGADAGGGGRAARAGGRRRSRRAGGRAGPEAGGKRHGRGRHGSRAGSRRNLSGGGRAAPGNRKRMFIYRGEGADGRRGL